MGVKHLLDLVLVLVFDGLDQLVLVQLILVLGVATTFLELFESDFELSGGLVEILFVGLLLVD